MAKTPTPPTPPSTPEMGGDSGSTLGQAPRTMAREVKLRQDWNAGDDLSTAPTEWRETPQSTRVARYRYDHGNGQIHVVFLNHGNGERNYVYREVPRSAFYNMNRVKSKGRFVSRVLNNYDYGTADGAW